LMRNGARFSCGDVLTKHVLKQLARRCRCKQANSHTSRKSRR
jgi:hypothetical protein